MNAEEPALTDPSPSSIEGSSGAPERVLAGLLSLYARRQPPVPWEDGENLPWNDPEFSARMLQEHLNQSHGAASRPLLEIRAMVHAMMNWLGLGPGSRLLDVTCGPGLYAAEFARQGVHVTGIDFGPASLAYARQHCAGLDCRFVESDVRAMDFDGAQFDAAIYIYGQPTVLRPAEFEDVLRRIRRALRPGAPLLLEILDYNGFDKRDNTWWYSGQGGLWGDFPYLHLGERTWDAEQQASIERFYIVNLETGALQEYGLSDQAYTAERLTQLLGAAGFVGVEVHSRWDGLALKDAPEWVVYVTRAA